MISNLGMMIIDAKNWERIMSLLPNLWRSGKETVVVYPVFSSLEKSEYLRRLEAQRTVREWETGKPLIRIFVDLLPGSPT